MGIHVPKPKNRDAKRSVLLSTEGKKARLRESQIMCVSPLDCHNEFYQNTKSLKPMLGLAFFR